MDSFTVLTSMEAHGKDGNQCGQMGTNGNQWEPMEANWDQWKQTEANGDQGVPMGQMGTTGSMEVNGSQWRLMEFNGAQWEPMGAIVETTSFIMLSIFCWVNGGQWGLTGVNAGNPPTLWLHSLASCR